MARGSRSRSRGCAHNTGDREDQPGSEKEESYKEKMEEEESTKTREGKPAAFKGSSLDSGGGSEARDVIPRRVWWLGMCIIM